ncbi:enterohemolysin [Salmonella enterica subsp. enterica serovar Coquilhatville]|nr:enterohemolysin [Salmonella enterica subsp. enterica serovar Coquilhatville]
MKMTNILDSHNLAPATITASNAIFSASMLGQLTAFANLMADSRVSVPDHLAGKPADCMAIVMQSMQWGMNPYAVAQKTHLVSGKLGYEAQLVNAVISSSTAISGRFHYEYGGDWSRCTISKEVTVKRKGSKGEYTVTERVRAWSDADEIGLFVRVGAVIRGEKDITWSEPLYLSSVVVRNSPLWVSNPKQQIAYLALKYWARLYTPDVILGVYTKEELEGHLEKEINPMPAPDRVDIQTLSKNVVIDGTEETQNVTGMDSWITDFRQRIEDADSTVLTTELRQEVEAQKKSIDIGMYTELKGKVVQRHHRLNAVNRIEKMINDLPCSGDPDAETKFIALENALNAVRPHLGELYDSYSITLNDLKPEYVGV